VAEVNNRIRFDTLADLGKVMTCESAGTLTLRCPVCDCAQTHVQAAYTRKGNDHGEAIAAYPGTEQRGTTPYRRSALCVLVEGETCGHQFEIVFQQHKGDTLVQMEILGQRDPHREPGVRG